MNKITKDITKTILFSCFALAAVGTAIALPGLGLLSREFVKCKKYERFRLKSTLKRLHKQRMIYFSEKPNGAILLELTEKGHKRILEYKFKEIEIKAPLKWDGLWRIVIFDIPNKKKQARDALREKLKELGFYKIQKSVFVHPYDCADEIKFIREFFDIGRFVEFIVAKEIDEDYKLRKLFLLD